MSKLFQEKIYLEKDFPDMTGFYDKSLPDSPKNLGISRADLWAFTGLVALDEYMMHSKTVCNHLNYNMTCGDESTPCYTKLPWSYTRLFKYGRSDCQPADHATEKQGYLASQVEAHPHLGFNGEMTVNYFKDKFKMNGKQALALMGVHTVGRFNPLTSKNDYSWVRDFSERPRLFNNEYFKNLALKPQKVKVNLFKKPFTYLSYVFYSKYNDNLFFQNRFILIK